MSKRDYRCRQLIRELRLRGENGDERFIDGVLSACQTLVVTFDQPGMAFEILGATASREKFLAAQKRSGYETRKMNKVIREVKP